MRGQRRLKLVEMATRSDAVVQSAQRAEMTDSHFIDILAEQEAETKLTH
jgi:hypothetical protein